MDRISEQMESFKRGINDVIPLSNLAVGIRLFLFVYSYSKIGKIRRLAP